MTASVKHPKQWQGKLDSSGWVVNPRENEKPMLNLKFRGMTDQEADQYCAPKGGAGKSASQSAQPRTGSQSVVGSQDLGDDDIPF